MAKVTIIGFGAPNLAGRWPSPPGGLPVVPPGYVQVLTDSLRYHRARAA